METSLESELGGQTSIINELLDEPVGAEPRQLVLPMHLQLPSGENPAGSLTRQIPAPEHM